MYEINKKYVLEQTTTNNKSAYVSVFNCEDGNKTLTINDKYVYSKYTPTETDKLQINVNNIYYESGIIIIFGSRLMYEIVEILKKLIKKFI